MQQKIYLNQQTIEQIRWETKQWWRPCQRKLYQVWACKVPSGYIFANKLEQPESYKAIQSVYHKDIIPVELVMQNPSLFNLLKNNGCYQTSEQKVVLCGTRGEMWDVKDEKFRASYELPAKAWGTDFPFLRWFAVMRRAESCPSAVGIQIPHKYLGAYQTSWATLFVNNPNSGGHGKGDILVCPCMQGAINYADASPTNNEVFALTYNLKVGGWSDSGLITNPEKLKPITKTFLDNCIKSRT